MPFADPEKRRLWAAEWRKRPHVIEARRSLTQNEGYKESRRKYMREYSKIPGNADRFRSYKKEYYQKPEVKERRKRYLKWYYSDPENQNKRSSQMAAYYARPEVKKRALIFGKNWTKKKRKTDLNFSIKLSLRGRLWWALKLGNATKLESAIDLVGCSYGQKKTTERAIKFYDFLKM